jgi:FkbM family methyltransferase
MRFYQLLYVLFFCIFSSVFAQYPQYKEFQIKNLKPEGAYMSFVDKIDKKHIKRIFEVGSRDAKDSLALSDYFKCHVYAFECNPSAIEICKSNIGQNPNVTLVPYGVWDKSGKRSFYKVKHENIGASSFFKINKKVYTQEKLKQKKISVDCIRLDEFLKENNIDGIDLLCMDVQGASYQVLSSLGDNLKNIKYIIVELEVQPLYSGEILYQDVDKFLLNSGFKRVSEPIDSKNFFGDFLYINSKLE